MFLGVAVRNGYKAGVEEGAIGQHTRHAFIHRLPLQVAAGERERLCWPPFYFLDLDSLLLLVVYIIRFHSRIIESFICAQWWRCVAATAAVCCHGRCSFRDWARLLGSAI